MDFFEAQDHARGLSRKLVLLYGVAVFTLIVGVYLVAAVALGVSGVTEPGAELGAFSLFDPALFAVVALGMGTMIGLGTAFRTAQLRKGGAAVAELLGGRRVDPGSTDPAEQQLMNVVEEMAIASGVPVPEVFILDREAGINAFAAGHTLNDAAVAVTRGALDAFSRDELQGVMAHEFSHILNGDMRLNIRLMGLLFGILLLTVVGRGIVRGSFYSRGGRRGGNQDRGGGQIVIIGVALVVLGYLGVMAGRLIQAAVSRQREYLADAAAVQFTRNPEGIAGALKRIGASSHGSRLDDHHAEEASHLFFARGTRKAFSGLTATHPPLPERIRRIDPAWDGSWEMPPPPPPRGRVQRGREGERPSSGGARGPGGALDPLLGPMGEALGGGRGGLPGVGKGGAPGGGLLLGAILGSAGSLGPGEVSEARRILSALPDEARARLRTPEGALEGVVGLLLQAARDTPLRAEVEAAVTERLGPRALQGGSALLPALEALPDGIRLPALELALPGLRGLPRERAGALLATVAQAVTAGLARGEGARLGVDPFLVVLHHLVRRNLPAGVAGEPGKRPGSGAGLERHRDDAVVLLDLLARAGSDDAKAVAEAKAAGIAALPGRPSSGEAGAASLTLERVEGAISALEGASAGARRAFLQAASAVVQADNRVEVAEAELIRALAEALEVPIPPLRTSGEARQADPGATPRDPSSGSPPSGEGLPADPPSGDPRHG